MTHGGIAAQLAIAAERPQIRQVDQMCEAVWRDAAYVPKQVEFEDALQPGQAGESNIAEWPVDQQMCGVGVAAVPLLQHREVVQQREASIRDESAAGEVE